MNQDEHTMHAAKALYDIACDMSLDQPTQVVAKMQVFLNELLDAERLTSNPAKVQGYTPQPDAKVRLVNEFKADEERLLRKLDRLGKETKKAEFGPLDVPAHDQRWLAIARTHFHEGFMALNRSVFQPTRIRLPEDEQ